MSNHFNSDFEECEYWISRELSIRQKRIIYSGKPYWEFDPPQRESYLTPLDYAIGLREYADRVLAHEGVKNK